MELWEQEVGFNIVKDRKKKRAYDKANSRRNRKFNWVHKIEVLSYYSQGEVPMCIHCNETDPRVLCIDHINGGGGKHRKELKLTSSIKFYRWLQNHDYPDGYQTLCYNCNIRKKYVELALYFPKEDG